MMLDPMHVRLNNTYYTRFNEPGISKKIFLFWSLRLRVDLNEK